MRTNCLQLLREKGQALKNAVAGAVVILSPLVVVTCAANPPIELNPGAESQTKEAPRERTAYPSFSLSGDGSRVVAELLGQRANTIKVFDLSSGASRDLRTEFEADRLREPDISDDGNSIAVVRGPDLHVGLSEVLIIDLEGRILDRIASCNGAYRKPAFSPDGRKLVYFKYANADLVEDEILSYRVLRTLVWQPMEFDLLTRVEKPLIDLAWLSVGWIDYDPVEPSKYFLRAQEPVGYDPNPHELFSNKKHWNTPNQKSILDQIGNERRQNVKMAAHLSLSPDDSNFENWIVPLDVNIAPEAPNLRFGGVSESGFLVTEPAPPFASERALSILAWDLTQRAPVSALGGLIYGNAVSRDGCAVLDARRSPESDPKVPTSIIMHYMCTPSDHRDVAAFGQARDTKHIRGAFENEC